MKKLILNLLFVIFGCTSCTLNAQKMYNAYNDGFSKFSKENENDHRTYVDFSNNSKNFKIENITNNDFKTVFRPFYFENQTKSSVLINAGFHWATPNVTQSIIAYEFNVRSGVFSTDTSNDKCYTIHLDVLNKEVTILKGTAILVDSFDVSEYFVGNSPDYPQDIGLNIERNGYFNFTLNNNVIFYGQNFEWYLNGSVSVGVLSPKTGITVNNIVITTGF